MTSFLLFLSVPLLVCLFWGYAVGWLGHLLPVGSWAWRLFWVASACFLPDVSLRGYWDETAKAAARMPQIAGVMHTFQWQLVLLAALTFGLTIWAEIRRPWLAVLPLPALFFVFYKLVLPPIFDSGLYFDDELHAQLDGATNRGLFMFCVFGAALLLGLALATLRPRRKLGA